MPGPVDIPPDSQTPHLGRAVAITVAALALMVAIGVVWVWQRARHEQAERARIQETESFQVPRRPSP